MLACDFLALLPWRPPRLHSHPKETPRQQLIEGVTDAPSTNACYFIICWDPVRTSQKETSFPW